MKIRVTFDLDPNENRRLRELLGIRAGRASFAEYRLALQQIVKNELGNQN